MVSSYTPTVTALLNQRVEQEGSPAHQVLAVAQPNTPHQSSLPGTVTEMASLAESLKESELLVLNSDGATKDIVLREMGRHPWIHLACHAFQDSADPTKSGFILHDKTLELVDIIKQSFTHTELAVLSACQTATGAMTLPEEAAHLAAGMLIAGYRSVVGTVWSVEDRDAPIFAQKLYSYLMDEGGETASSRLTPSTMQSRCCARRLEMKTLFVGYLSFIPDCEIWLTIYQVSVDVKFYTVVENTNVIHVGTRWNEDISHSYLVFVMWDGT